MRKNNLRQWLASGVAAGVLSLTITAPALAEQATFTFDQPSMPMSAALQSVGRETGVNILVDSGLVRDVRARELRGQLSADDALLALLDGTGLSVRKTDQNSVMIVRTDAAPQSGSAARDGATVEALIVTAQKREENIQDVPIAISAFSQKALEAQKIEGGFDLLKAIPNVTFSKNNFTSFNFSIRGVGTKAISATTDPGVSVSFNNTGLIQNRLFEQEYFDVERVEVLRGPQGTLYGRNATSGVINVISAKPDLNDFDGWIKGEVGNYHAKRASAMINIPIVEDKLAIRFAGAFTDRQGYDFNEGTGNAVNGRDLWSARLTLGFEPTERLRGNLIWERFNEDDNRSRTGKQLCKRDPGLTEVGGVEVIDRDENYTRLMRPALFSQGCLPVNLYDDRAFDTPNGLALPFVFGVIALGGQCGVGCTAFLDLGGATLVRVEDPYGGVQQSHDLRVINSFRDPIYRAKADVVELNLEFDVSPALTLVSQTAYNKDEVYSFQDFNRFNTYDVFTDTSQLASTGYGGGDFRALAPGGVFCDPQLGCSSKMAGFDISSAKGSQFSQELRLQSSFDGPLNFSLGANYTRFETLIDYYVMFNLITAMAMTPPFNAPIDGVFDPSVCAYSGFFGSFSSAGVVPIDDPAGQCPYIDPNPIESINGEGHNYFRSKNPYKLRSWAGFGEMYYQISDTLKLTAGLRYTDDKKTFIPVPSQVLLAQGPVLGGVVNRGYPEDPPIVQKWGEWTGRLGLDWKPVLTFTDSTLLYAFYSRGYKGGGANPPRPGFGDLQDGIDMMRRYGFPDAVIEGAILAGNLPILELTADEYAPTFEPEFVDAFELGAKNTLLNGAMTFNATAFYYDYKDYQVSQIRDRTAVNENFDAKVWGLEFEAMFSPTRDLQLVANLGYLDTRIADGETSIDIMNRTQGNPDYVLAKPWIQLPSNCVVPVHMAREWLNTKDYLIDYWGLCGGVGGLWAGRLTDPLTGQIYDPDNYPELNGGAGLLDELGGNELPNAPHWTANIGGQYGWDILEGWRATVRADAYWQSQSWHRVYNADPYDKLHGWTM